MDSLTSSNPGWGSRVEMSMNTADSLEDGKGRRGCTITRPEGRENSAEIKLKLVEP